MVQGRRAGLKDWERVWPKERIKVQETVPIMQTKEGSAEDDSRRKEKQYNTQDFIKAYQTQSNSVWEA